MKVFFPEYNPDWGKKQDIKIPGQWHRYYDIHYKYFRNLLLDGGAEIEFIDATEFTQVGLAFELLINDNLVLVDYSDYEKLKLDNYSKYKAVFKFHFNGDKHSHINNLYPFSPVNFDNWELYRQLLKDIEYKADKNGFILNNQAIAGAAVERRERVRDKLAEVYRDKFDYKLVPQSEFFKKINNCLVSVCVPGARNNMLDRGQGQYMGFGACTISPRLVTIHSRFKRLQPGKHYIKCRYNYKDLIDKIEWCRQNTERCIEIGQNAKQLFQSVCTPIKQVEWIENCLSNE